MPSIDPPKVWPCRLRGLRTVPTSETAVYSRIVNCARLDVDLDFGEADDERARLAVARVVVARGGDQSLAGQVLHRRLRPVVHVLRRLVAVVLAAELDRFLRRPARTSCCGRRRTRGRRPPDSSPGLPPSVFAATSWISFFAVGADGVRRARHRVRGLAAARRAGPRQVLARVAEDDLALLPRHAEDVRRDAMHVEHRVRAEIADARLNLHLAVGTDDQQAVEARSTRRSRC